MGNSRGRRLVAGIVCALGLARVASSATFDNATFTSDYFVGNDTFVNGVTLSSANLTIGESRTATFSGSQTVFGTGAIVISSENGVKLAATAGSVLTLSSGITLRTGTAGNFGDSGVVSAPIVNFGTISAQTSSLATVTINSLDNRNAVNVTAGKLSLGALTNTGTVTVAAAAGDLYFTGAVDNTAGSIVQNSGRIYFSGTTPTTGLTNFTRNAGTLQVSGTLDNTGNTFNLDALGQIDLTGTLKGGTFTGSSNAFAASTGGTPTFDGVTLGSSFTYTGFNSAPITPLNLTNGLTLLAGTTFTLQSNGNGTPPITTALSFTGSQTLAGSGTLVFDNKTVRVAATTGTLTIAPGITIRTGTGDAALGSTTTSFANQGTIRVTSGRSMWIGGSWTNAGTIDVESGGNLHIACTINFANYGAINRPAGANLFMAGSLTNTGNTFDFGNTPLGVMNFGGGSIAGGTVTSSAGEVRVVASPGDNTALMSGVSLDADLAVEGGTELFFTSTVVPVAGRKIRLTGADSRFSNSNNTVNVGELIFDGTPGQLQYALDTFSSNLTISSGTIRTGTNGGKVGSGLMLTNRGTLSAQTAGRNLSIGVDTLVNAGTLAVSNGGMSFARAVNNDGAINVSGGTLTFNGFGFTNRSTGVVAVTGGTLYAGPNWSNAGSIAVSGSGTFRTPSLPASYGNLAINGGTLEIDLPTANTTTAKVKQFTASNATLSLTGNGGGLDNTGQSLELSPAWFNTLRLANFVGLIGGTLIGNPTAKITSIPNAAARLKGVTISNEIEVNALIALSNGLTLASGATLTLRSTAAQSTQVTVEGNQTVGGNGSIVFTGTGGSISTNGANVTWTIAPGVTLRNDGVDASINNGPSPTLINQGKISSQSAAKTITLRGASVTNSGTLEARDGGKISLLASIVDNTGLIFVGSGSTITAAATITGTGTIAGGGKIIGNVSTGGGVRPGESPGMLELDGNFTFQPSSTLYVELGETSFDVLDVSGAVTLAGKLDVTLAGDSPEIGDQFQFIQAGSFAGTFSDWSLPPLSAGQWDTSQLSQGTLSVIVPEPLSPAFLTAAIALPLLRRRRA
jgi:fibronectin-binding autotransporter adhesin